MSDLWGLIQKGSSCHNIHLNPKVRNTELAEMLASLEVLHISMCFGFICTLRNIYMSVCYWGCVLLTQLMFKNPQKCLNNSNSWYLSGHWNWQTRGPLPIQFMEISLADILRTGPGIKWIHKIQNKGLGISALWITQEITVLLLVRTHYLNPTGRHDLRHLPPQHFQLCLACYFSVDSFLWVT